MVAYLVVAVSFEFFVWLMWAWDTSISAVASLVVAAVLAYFLFGYGLYEIASFSLKAAPVYLAAGLVWSVVKWWFYVKKCAREYEALALGKDLYGLSFTDMSMHDYTKTNDADQRERVDRQADRPDQRDFSGDSHALRPSRGSKLAHSDSPM